MKHDKMRALRLNAFSSWENLSLETVSVPAPDAQNPILVKVKAASINPVDMKMCSGKGLASYMKDNLPVTLGYDMAGEVVSAPENTGYSPGDRVCGMIGFPAEGGAFSEYAVTRPEDITRVPDEVSFEDAAASPAVGLTAWQSLFELGNLEPGETVLITGASGGVGQYMVQLAHWKGARVIGTCSKRNVEYVASIGADVVLDYTKDSLSSVTENVDLFINGVIHAQDAVKTPGATGKTRKITIVTIPEDNPELKAFFPTRMLVHPDREQLVNIMELLSRKVLTPRIAGRFELEDFREAFELIATGHAGGKVLLIP
jgi:NADPH:quinone reductase